jgi:hypothetical protein
LLSKQPAAGKRYLAR